MIDMMVVSHATFRSVNRAVYQLLQQEFGLSVEMTAPQQLSFSGKILPPDPPQHENEIIHFLNLKGDNPRTFDFEGLYDLLDQLRPRVIYLENDPVSMQAIKLGRWCKKNAAKLFCLSCENLPIDPWSSFQRTGLRGLMLGGIKMALLQISKPNVTQVFTINDAGTALFKKYQFKHVSKIPLGFDPNLFQPNTQQREIARAELALGDLFAIAYIGRLVPEKGVDLLLKSLKKIEHLPWVFILDKFKASPGTYQATIFELIATLGLTDRVRYFDASHSEIAQYMNAADVVVIPSISTPRWVEQYGRVAPEAMACGRLVLAANSGALPELIADAGLLFPEGDTERLAEILTDLIQHPSKYQAYQEKAQQRAYQYLSINTQGAMLYAAFKPYLQVPWNPG